MPATKQRPKKTPVGPKRKRKSLNEAGRWKNRIVGQATVPASRLIPNDRNWRLHPEAQKAALAGVLDQVGWVQRVIVNKRTGKLVDGHERLAQALAKGPNTKIPVLYVDLSAEEEALVLASLDPLSAMAGTDADKLAGLVAELPAIDSDELMAMLTGLVPQGGKEGLTDPDESPTVPTEPITVSGDLWLCGDHRVLCADSTGKSAVSRARGDLSPLLMVTDPPYGVGYDPKWRDEYEATSKPTSFGKPNTRPQTGKMTRHALGRVQNDHQIDWSPAFRLFTGDVAYVWHAGVHAPEVAAALIGAGLLIRSQIVWAKQHFVFGRGVYHWQHEPCWYAVKKRRTAHWRGGRKQSTLWDIQNLNPMGGNREEAPTGHGTQKPVEAMRRPILNHTKPGEAVYDPFLGSGTTMIAAEQTGRICLGIDIDPAYVDVAVIRWQDFTGKKACNEDGELFESVARSRGRALAA